MLKRRLLVFADFETRFDILYWLFFRQIFVDFFYQFIRVCVVNGTGVLYAFAARRGAAQTMHADFKKKFRSSHIIIQNVADNALFCNNHFIHPFDRKTVAFITTAFASGYFYIELYCLFLLFARIFLILILFLILVLLF